MSVAACRSVLQLTTSSVRAPRDRRQVALYATAVEALEVLRCKQCDAPLALADGESVTCPSCNTVNDIPTAYRELHRARVLDAAERERAERVLRSLDRPASVVVKVLARVFDQNMFAFMLMFGVPMILAAVMIGMRVNDWFARHYHYKSADDVPFAVMLIVMCAVMFVLAFVPRALGVYASRRVAERGRLLAALAARPPTVAGAASQCRSCGAPLAIEPDAILAVCAYCHAQNAVHLDTKLVDQAKGVARTIGREIAEAASYDRKERSATRRKLFRELLRYFVRTALLGGAFALATQETPERTPTKLGIVGSILTLGLFVYFLIRSLGTPDPDAADRRAANDVPSWVSIVGPLVFLVLLAKFGHC
jgi:LSD1 subclass zinc finger protein